jgi:hypothetical protein
MSSKGPRHVYVSKETKNSNENDDFFYNECRNVCPSIAEALRRPENEGCINLCKSPSSYGLVNSEQIIPNYYFTGKDLKGKMLECDFYFSIIDSIRNMRVLSRYQQQYIERLEKEDCYQLLHEYNRVMKSVADYIMAD